MVGREVSVLSFVDGTHIKIMSSAQDHKRALDGDQGLNTGGMGTFSPSPFYTQEIDEFCKKNIYQATVDAMENEGRKFKGIIFFGLIDQQELEFEENAAVCVVLASKGYPLQYEKGYEISGLEKFLNQEDYLCFHAATILEDGLVKSNGGRVLGITAKGKTLDQARIKAYEATKWIDFKNKFMRLDIGNAINDTIDKA